MADLDTMLLSYVARYGSQGALPDVQKLGISSASFIDEYVAMWTYITRYKRQHDEVPSPEMLMTRFPDFTVVKVMRRDLPGLVQDLHNRAKGREVYKAISDALERFNGHETVDEVIQNLQGRLNRLSTQTGAQPTIDLFSDEARKRLVADIKRRGSEKGAGIPTGFPKLDEITGGLQRQKMVVVIGRTSRGKTWVNLWFVASALMAGYRVNLYPLEMTLEDTAYRLYTILSRRMFGIKGVLPNDDLNQGRISPARASKVLREINERFSGQLRVADVGALSHSYTIERIEADLEESHCDLFWVDYLTLMQTPRELRREDWQGVSYLSKGIKDIATRRNVVGGCSAQVNREALRENVFLPRLEHISYGDALGQDANQVVSINSKDGYLYYALVKNREGAEIPQVKVSFDPNLGIIDECPESLQSAPDDD